VYDNISGKAVITPKSYGKTIKPSDLPDGFTKFFPLASKTEPGATDSPVSEHGLPRHLLLPILNGIRDDIIAKRSAFEQIHLRMPGESILIAYEADWQRAEEALKAQEASKQADAVDQQSDDVGVADSDQEQEADGHEGDDDDEEDEDGDDEDGDEESAVRFGPAYAVKLIDFAHTRLKPGEGPDEGALVGLNTILKLLDGRIAHVEASIT
jgi:1D-myo-inositol-tetrakisphosphate 5-kinase/inositol-polyphosphate multikinase